MTTVNHHPVVVVRVRLPLLMLGCFSQQPATTLLAYTPSSLGRPDLAGVWSLGKFQPSSSLQKEGSCDDDELPPSLLLSERSEILLKLHEDGSFEQYGAQQELDTLKEQEGLLRWQAEAEQRGSDGIDSSSPRKNASMTLSFFLNGTWEYQDETLFLAADRRSKLMDMPSESSSNSSSNGGSTDTLLAGRLLARSVASGIRLDGQGMDSHEEDGDYNQPDETIIDDVYLSVPQCSITAGRFMYPRRHPSFFQHGLVSPTFFLGTCCMKQVLGTLNAIRIKPPPREKNKEARYHKRDLHNRTFLLAVAPLQHRPPPTDTKPLRVWSRTLGTYVAERRNDNDDDIHQQDGSSMLDVRVMPITFFPNNTFSARGTNKILRGRFGTTGEEKEKLWFSVSLFGSGRSVTGSVYSEGQGLTHDDRRTYVGDIQEIMKKSSVGQRAKQLNVEGSVVYGADFGSDARPHPVGTFVMREIRENEDGGDDEMEEEEESNDKNNSPGAFE